MQKCGNTKWKYNKYKNTNMQKIQNAKKQNYKNEKYIIRSAITLSISLAVHLDQVFMLGIRG